MREMFKNVEGRGALIVIVDPTTKVARGHVAWNVGKGWKVAAGGGFKWEGPRQTSGWLGVEFVW
jgi:hypothetical protein